MNDRRGAASVLITYQVPDGAEAEFLTWQRRIQVAQTKFRASSATRSSDRSPACMTTGSSCFSFDSEAHLQGWLDSAERKALIEEGGRFGDKFKVSHSNYGFDFWFPGDAAPSMNRHGIFKSNLLVLLMLYPIVFLWNYLVDGPLVQGRAGALFLAGPVHRQHREHASAGLLGSAVDIQALRLVVAIEDDTLPADRGIRDPRDLFAHRCLFTPPCCITRSERHQRSVPRANRRAMPTSPFSRGRLISTSACTAINSID